MLVSYGRVVLALPPLGAEVYTRKYKGIWVCLTALSRAMSGNYVNFGVFELYGDMALKVRRHPSLRGTCVACKNLSFGVLFRAVRRHGAQGMRGALLNLHVAQSMQSVTTDTGDV